MKRLPAEFETQRATVLLFPYREDVWRRNCSVIRELIIDLANTIARYEPVVLGVLPKLVDFVKLNYKLASGVNIVPLAYNDCWPRDSVSSVIEEDGKKHIASFGFNAYGDGLYRPWDDDAKLDVAMSRLFCYPLKKVDLILEGGNILTDGHGTLFAVKDAILNDNRNPGVTLEEIECRLKEATGCTQIVWIERGLSGDETGGHIDNILAFADANTLIMSYTDDKRNPHYEITHEIERVIKNTCDTSGKPYNIIKLPVPDFYKRKPCDSEGIVDEDGSFPRRGGDPVLDTYINFALVNGAVIVPQFGYEDTDKQSIEIIKGAFKDRDVIPMYSREASLGGGGLHCLSKHIN